MKSSSSLHDRPLTVLSVTEREYPNTFVRADISRRCPLIFRAHRSDNSPVHDTQRQPTAATSVRVVIQSDRFELQLDVPANLAYHQVRVGESLRPHFCRTVAVLQKCSLAVAQLAVGSTWRAADYCTLQDKTCAATRVKFRALPDKLVWMTPHLCRFPLKSFCILPRSCCPMRCGVLAAQPFSACPLSSCWTHLQHRVAVVALRT